MPHVFRAFFFCLLLVFFVKNCLSVELGSCDRGEK